MLINMVHVKIFHLFMFYSHPQMLEHQMEVREKEVQSLQSQAVALSQEEAGMAEVDGQQKRVIDSFSGLQDPLNLRRQKLLASKEAHQFNRDLEDEIVSYSKSKKSIDVFVFYFCLSEVLFLVYSQLWVKERMPLASSTDHGKDLPTVQLLIKKNQVQLPPPKHTLSNAPFPQGPLRYSMERVSVVWNG